VATERRTGCLVLAVLLGGCGYVGVEGLAADDGRPDFIGATTADPWQRCLGPDRTGPLVLHRFGLNEEPGLLVRDRSTVAPQLHLAPVRAEPDRVNLLADGMLLRDDVLATDSIASAALTEALVAAGSFSVELVATVLGSDGALLSIGTREESQPAGGLRILRRTWGTDLRVQMPVQNGDGTGWMVDVNFGSAFTFGLRQHLFVSFDRGIGMLAVHLDGVLRDTRLLAGGVPSDQLSLPWASTAELTMGHWGGEQMLVLHRLAIYDEVLNAEEVACVTDELRLASSDR
jgi:hypothetical protein